MAEDTYEIDLEMMGDFIDESLEALSIIPGLFVELESNPDNLSIIEAIFRPVHSLKGNAAYFGLMKTKALAHEMESLLDDLRRSRLLPTRDIIDGLLCGVDEIIRILENSRGSANETLDEEGYQKILKDVKSLGRDQNGIVSQDSDAPPPAKKKEKLSQMTTQELWEFVFADIAALKFSKKMTTGPEAEILERMEESLTILSQTKATPAGPEENTSEAPPAQADPAIGEDSSPLKQLETLLNMTDEDKPPKERAEDIGNVLLVLTAAAKSEEAKKATNRAMDDFQVFMETIGLDPLLIESLTESLVTLKALPEFQQEPGVPETPQQAEANNDKQTPPEPKPELSLKDEDFQTALLPNKPEPTPMGKPETTDVADPPAKPASEKKTTTGKEVAKEKSEPASTPAQPPVPVQEAKPQAARAESPKELSRTMRVSEDSIDAFLSYVGELISVDEMFRYIHAQLAQKEEGTAISSALLHVINTFTKLSDDLQHSIMEIRKVSVNPLLQKNQRIVRDIAHNAGKNIEVKLVGQELMIDRSLIETLEAPMLHMVRNAADHGIENPADRIAAGKEERGHILVSMVESEDQIMLTVKDDGRGLDMAKIKTKAVDMGLLKPEAELDERALVNFIFASGMSTAEKVTDVSGRGVGMDAVKRGVEDAGGQISVKSETGHGCTFQITLPTTVGTQIINSFVVTIGHQRFVLPMDRISGSYRPCREECTRMPNRTVRVNRNGKILPIFDLGGPYCGPIERLTDGILINFESLNKPLAFFVDQILGLQKVVLRKVPWVRMQKFVGAGVMGDGHVSLILDVDAISN